MKPLRITFFVVLAGLALSPERLGRAFAQARVPLDEPARDRLTEQKRAETIEQLERIVSKIDDRSGQKAELLYQLSELYVEKSRQLLHAEMAEHDKQYRAYEESRKQGAKGLAEPRATHQGSESYRAKAIALYDRILREYPAYPRKDEVLFALGYNLYEIGKRSDGVARYLELIKAYPNSIFVPDTYLQLGNHYFDIGNDLGRARHFYEKALASDLPKVHSYALYKLAWCDYNVGQFENTLQKLRLVVDFAQTHGREMVDLKNEALSDMTSAYVRLGRSEEAIEYFQRMASEKLQRKLIVRLAAQLAEAGQFDKGISVYRYLIARAPNLADAPEHQQAIIRCYEGLRDRVHVKSEVRRLVDLYRPGGDWWKANQTQKDFLRNAFSVSEEALRTLAVDYHQEAQRTKQVDTYRLARDIYAQYVEAFASSPDPSFISDQALNMRFYYAEILWGLEEWENAANQYAAVIGFKVPDRESAREASDERFRKTAAYNVVLAYDKLVKIDRGELAKPDLKTGQTLTPGEKNGLERKTIERKSAKGGSEEALTRHEEKLVAGCDLYNKLYPGDQDEVELRYLTAVIYYQRRHFQEAAQRFEQIADKWPEDPRSLQAADLSMHILETREDWLELNRLSRHFLRSARLTKPGTDFGKRVAKVVEGSQYKWVDEVVYQKEKNPAKAAQEFIRLADEFPRSEYAPRALTYAMIAFGDAQQLDAAISAGERVLSHLSAYELKVRFTLARYYEKVADFPKAAAMYESFVAAYDRRAAEGEAAKTARPSKADVSSGTVEVDERVQLLGEAEKRIADAQFNAGLWWEALSKTEKATAAYRTYVSRFKEAQDAPEVKLTLGSLYEKSRKWAEALKTYREFESEYGKDKRVSSGQRYLVKYRELVSLRQLGNIRESDRLLEGLVREYGRLKPEARERPDIQEAYASARFWKVEPLWTEYSQLKLNRVATLRRDLDAKRRKLAALEKEYTEVLAAGSADFGIAAITRIGLAYLDLSENIVASAEPRGLTEEQLQLYRGELKNLAAPIEVKAGEAFEKAVQKGRELGVYNDWILLAQDNINKFHPGAYAKTREVSYLTSQPLAKAPLQTDTGQMALGANPRLSGSSAPMGSGRPRSGGSESR